MYLHVPDNGYHTPTTVYQPTSVIAALLDTYRKRANRRISIKEYRKTV